MRKIIITIVIIALFSLAGIKNASAKVRDYDMTIAGAISVSLIVVMVWSALSGGEDEHQENKNTDMSSVKFDPFSDNHNETSINIPQISGLLEGKGVVKNTE